MIRVWNKILEVVQVSQNNGMMGGSFLARKNAEALGVA